MTHMPSVRWCAHGALEKAAFDLTGDYFAAIAIAIRVRDELNELAGRDFTEINDKVGREAVVALFKKALAA